MNTPSSNDVVFLFDVDNTLLDNDHVLQDLRMHMTRQFGEANSSRYWQIFEDLRDELGYADYLGALQRYRHERQDDTQLLLMSCYLIDYPFANRIFPGALDALRYAGQFGQTAILSDGDVVFQPRKVSRAGLWDEVEGRVLIYIHKEQMLDDVIAHFPARHYVMVDDKLRILTAMKEQWGDRLTTIFPRQGHYALDEAEIAKYPDPDITIERIGELTSIDFDGLAAKRRN
jgi:FMN phosphatase YigB (HAD superfamily)